MRKLFSLLTALIIAIPVFAQTENLIYDKLEKPAKAEYYHTPVGLCEDWPEESTTRDIYVNDFKLLKSADINLLRISFGWDAIENEKDKYDWLFWDDLVKTGVEEYNITLVPYICYTPRWLARDPQDSLMFWNDPPADFNEFGEFMFDLVTRYKKYIKTWELWNEPDIAIYWDTEDVVEFARFVKIGAEAVKKADPEAKVVLGGIAYRPDWVRQLFRDHGVSPYIDIVNAHNYFETWSYNPTELLPAYINEVHDVITMYGDKQPIWIAEIGYSTFKRGNFVSDSYTGKYDYEHTPAYQAVDLVKKLALTLSTEKVSAIAWYEIKDLPPSDEVIGDQFNNKHLGVANADHSPKPALKALQFFNTLFASPVKSIDDQVKVTKTAGSDTYTTAFQDEKGNVIVAAWLKTHVPGEDVKTDQGLKDTRSESIDVEIPMSLSGKVTMYDELGAAKDYKSEKSGNGVTLKGLELQGGKVVFIKLEK